MLGKPSYEKAKRRSNFWSTWGIPIVLLVWFLGLGQLLLTSGMFSPAIAVAQIVLVLLGPIIFVAAISERRYRQFGAVEFENVPVAIAESEGT